MAIFLLCSRGRFWVPLSRDGTKMVRLLRLWVSRFSQNIFLVMSISAFAIRSNGVIWIIRLRSFVEKENSMKYIALIYSSERDDPMPGSDEFNQLISEYGAATQTFITDGVLVAGDPLESVNTATTVRIRNGKVACTDGPFAETKEQLGGYYIFDCGNLDEAIKYAALIPTAKNGSIEVRPIMDME